MKCKNNRNYSFIRDLAMTELQTQFNKFHDAIKIDFDGNEPLRNKRDIIVDNLRAGLKRSYPHLTFDSFNQGSYDMATGVEPLDGDDYDIDVGIVFNLTKDNVEPVILKQIVHDILDSVSQRKVEIKRPCVRVQYQKASEKAYHIDLAIYSHGTDIRGNMNDTLYIAKGLLGSSTDKKIWEISDPYQLKELIKTKISDNSDREQFRRVVRYLKRWKDYNFSSSGAERPTGIALTACCFYLFSMQKYYDYPTGTYRYNDLKALSNVVNVLVNTFNTFNGYTRITVKLPVRPENDLFEKMSDTQMLNFKQKLETLKTALESATNDVSTYAACTRLIQVFGRDFPTS